MIDLKEVALLWLTFFIADRSYRSLTEVVGKLMEVFSKPKNRLWELVDATRHLWGLLLFRVIVYLTGLGIVIVLALQSHQRILLSVSLLEGLGQKVTVEIALKDFLRAICLGLVLGVGVGIWTCREIYKAWKSSPLFQEAIEPFLTGQTNLKTRGD